jgi:hypothetical protein
MLLKWVVYVIKRFCFFGQGSRDTSQLYIFLTVYRHDLIGLKIGDFGRLKMTGRGRMG